MVREGKLFGVLCSKRTYKAFPEADRFKPGGDI